MKYRTRDSDWSSLREKIEHYLDKQPDGCWIWTKGKNQDGYGLVCWNGKTRPVHRAYLIELGHEYPPGYVTDHLCRVRDCANPDHLEIVTNGENVLRGFGPPAMNRGKTHCKFGHEFTPENTYILAKNGGRYCRECTRIRQRRLYAEHRDRRDTP